MVRIMRGDLNALECARILVGENVEAYEFAMDMAARTHSVAPTYMLGAAGIMLLMDSSEIYDDTIIKLKVATKGDADLAVRRMIQFQRGQISREELLCVMDGNATLTYQT